MLQYYKLPKAQFREHILLYVSIYFDSVILVTNLTLQPFHINHNHSKYYIVNVVDFAKGMRLFRWILESEVRSG